MSELEDAVAWVAKTRVRRSCTVYHYGHDTFSVDMNSDRGAGAFGDFALAVFFLVRMAANFGGRDPRARRIVDLLEAFYDDKTEELSAEIWHPTVRLDDIATGSKRRFEAELAWDSLALLSGLRFKFKPRGFGIAMLFGNISDTGPKAAVALVAHLLKRHGSNPQFRSVLTGFWIYLNENLGGITIANQHQFALNAVMVMGVALAPPDGTTQTANSATTSETADKINVLLSESKSRIEELCTIGDLTVSNPPAAAARVRKWFADKPNTRELLEEKATWVASLIGGAAGDDASHLVENCAPASIRQTNWMKNRAWVETVFETVTFYLFLVRLYAEQFDGISTEHQDCFSRGVAKSLFEHLRELDAIRRLAGNESVGGVGGFLNRVFKRRFEQYESTKDKDLFYSSIVALSLREEGAPDDKPDEDLTNCIHANSRSAAFMQMVRLDLLLQGRT